MRHFLHKVIHKLEKFVQAPVPCNIRRCKAFRDNARKPQRTAAIRQAPTRTPLFFMSFLHAKLPEIWRQRGPLAWLLRPLSWLYGALWQLRSLAYCWGLRRSGHPGVPVIVVGNVVAGGAGKTPTTIALVQHLQARGLAVGVVSRGHGRSSRQVCAVRPDSTAQEVGDEPLLIQRRTRAPVWVGASRLEAAQHLLRAHPQVRVLVCDDGLQHLGLQRDLEICVMDERGAGNGWLLPAGPLREPWPRPVDLLLYTDGRPRPGAHWAQRALGPEAINAHGETRDLKALAATAVDAVAGLARPEAFFAMLQASGLQLAQTWPRPDHDGFVDWCPPEHGRPLLCTEKDAVKLWRQRPGAWAVPLRLEVSPAFWQALDVWLQRQGLLDPATDTAHE